MGSVVENLAEVRTRIVVAATRSGREPETVQLVAVSKHQPVEAIRQAMEAGQMLFGENYLQEAQEKIGQLGARGGWHCIGHVQSNKARLAAELFQCVETVDRVKLAAALDKRLTELGRRMDVLVQVNVGGEAQKSGVNPQEAAALCEALQQFPMLRLRGLMTMPPWQEDPEASRPYFRQLRLLAEKLAAAGLLGQHGPVMLSMGMSADFEVAIEEGATLVRVGTALFGERL